MSNHKHKYTGLYKFELTAHITSSVGWLGAVVGFLALVVATLTSLDAQTVRAAYIAMELTGWFAIVPLALASLLTGLVMSLGTQWGLFRHYWVLFKLLLTILATIVLLLNMQTVSFLAGVAAETESVGLGGLRGELVHAGGGLLVLFVITILSVYKPRGMTPYGRRKQHEQPKVSRLLQETRSTMDKKRIALVIAVIAVIGVVGVLISVPGTDLVNKFMEMHGGRFIEMHRGR
jgi:hypothetical protein